MFECRWGVVCWGSAVEDLARGTVAERKKIKKIQKKSIKQILQEITNVLTAQRNLIMSLCKLKSEDIILHAMSLEAQANLKIF